VHRLRLSTPVSSLLWQSEIIMIHLKLKTKLNSMAWVREWTIPTERPPVVGEVIANFLRIEGATWSAWRILRPYSLLSRQDPLLFFQVAPQLYSGGRVDPVPDPILFFLVVPGMEPGPPDLSQELWPLDQLKLTKTIFICKRIPVNLLALFAELASSLKYN
jgi:hypothetical protein